MSRTSGLRGGARARAFSVTVAGLPRLVDFQQGQGPKLDPGSRYLLRYFWRRRGWERLSTPRPRRTKMSSNAGREWGWTGDSIDEPSPDGRIDGPNESDRARAIGVRPV